MRRKMNLVEEINNLKKQKNAIILTHCYQNIEMDEISDFVGDSLYLSKMAAKTTADIIVFAGVYFMAQTAKLLSPTKKVLLPNMNSGCLMADMIDAFRLDDFKAKHPNIPVVCYVNSTAEVKAKSDICCTSSNALKIVKSLNAPKVLFLPDANLGKWVESKLSKVEVISYAVFCLKKNKIRIEDVEQARKNYPNALILAHPECHSEVLKLVDFVGSTKEIMDFAAKSNEKQFVIATEIGVVDRLTRDYPDKKFILINEKITCPNMKQNTLHDVCNVLRNENNEINIEKNIFSDARKCIEKMFYVNV